MSIASEITRINNNIASAYTACNNKGATMPATQNSANLATCISSITGGSATLITKNITQNGTYNASSDNADGYSSVTVNVSGSFTGINREVVNGVYQAPTTSFTWSLPSTATDIGQSAMYYAFYQSMGITNVDLSSLTTLSGTNAMYYAFYQCTRITNVDLSSLTTVSGQSAMQYAFQSCSGITGTLDLSSLTTLSGTNAMYYAFYGCTGLTSVDLSSLTTVNNGSAMQYAFQSCSGITGTLDLSSLTTVSGTYAMGSTFYGTGITNVDLSSLQTIGANSSSTNYGQFSQCFNHCNALTSISFPNLEKIYCNGGTSGTYGTFANNKQVQKMYFPKLNAITYGSGASSSNQNACKNVFYGCSALTELHFGSANQSAIQASPGYSTAWGRGAGNVTIYFDL